MLENQNINEDAFEEEKEVSSLKRKIKSSQYAIKVPKTVRIENSLINQMIETEEKKILIS